jgi:positive regulator of sigma E activity
MLPLLSLIVATLISHHYLLNDAFTALCAIAGLLIGAAIVRLCSHLIRFDRRLQPVVIDEQFAEQEIQTCALE